MLPAIVVNAYNRPAALARLLNSLQQAVYPVGAQVPLIISIDRGGDPQVRVLAENFAWPHGPKTVTLSSTAPWVGAAFLRVRRSHAAL